MKAFCTCRAVTAGFLLACGQARLAGRGTSIGALLAEFVAYGLGRSAAVIFRKVPDFIDRKSMNAAGPAIRFALSTFCCAA